MKTILTKEIRSIIDKNEPNKLYMVSDFAHLNNDGLVIRTLSRLERGCAHSSLLRSIFISITK